jgi:hypothetical protein
MSFDLFVQPYAVAAAGADAPMRLRLGLGNKQVEELE